MPEITSRTLSIPESAQFVLEVGRLESRPRAEAVAAIKELRARELATIARQQLEGLTSTAGGGAVALAITGFTDVIIRALARRAFAKVGAPAGWEDGVGIFALGGYGRGELNPQSDIDLLVLAADSRAPEWLTKGNAEFQALMWDVKFTVGASSRGAGELDRLLEDDFVTATAVIEQRPLLAGPRPIAALADILARLRRKRSVPFLKFKLEELAKRRSQAGVSLFQMEPNLKTNPGCLRDVQLLSNIAFIAFGSRELARVADLEVITQHDLAAVESTNDHLLCLRSLLHFHHGRKQDIFQLADQVRVAKQLGYSDLSQLRAVEHFMKEHYARVLHVHQILELAVSRLKATGHLGRWTLLIKTRKVLDKDFTAVQGQVYLSHADFWSLPDAGARLVRMCRLAQTRGMRLSLELQRAIKTHLGVFTDAVRGDRALARVFLELIGDFGRTQLILEDMHNAGLLGAYLPEFGNLTCHMQFDSYHQFTVDQHTLFAMGNLDAVANGTIAGLPGMAAIFARQKRKDILGLSLLLHDMGKYMGRGHVARGAIMAGGVAERFGLDERETELFYFLVERHVALSDASRMRDFHEPSFLRAFAEKIGTQDNLEALYCLTYGDARAVGEGILTGWQEALLSDLYQTLSAHFRDAGATIGSRHERLAAALVVSGVPTERAEAFLQDLPHSYLHQVAAGEIVRHYTVLQEARASGVGLHYELKDKSVFLVAAVPDRHALFADVTATLSGHGFDIIDARTWVSVSGMVIYSYRLSSIYPSRLNEEAPWTRFRADLFAVSQGRLSAETLLEKRRNSLTLTKPADSGFDDPAVKVEQRTSEDYTIVDIHTKDEVGLLSKLCRAISTHGCEISYACINTMGDVAVDVFYVYRDGSKLSDEAAETLRAHLIQTLNLAPVGR